MSNPSKFKDNDEPSAAENKAMDNWEDGFNAGIRHANAPKTENTPATPPIHSDPAGEIKANIKPISEMIYKDNYPTPEMLEQAESEYKGKTLLKLFVENNCTEDEQNQLRAFLFVLRNKRINFSVLEGVIKKYEDILKFLSHER